MTLETHAGSLTFHSGLSSFQSCSLPWVHVGTKADFTWCVSLGTVSTCQVHWNSLLLVFLLPPGGQQDTKDWRNWFWCWDSGHQIFRETRWGVSGGAWWWQSPSPQGAADLPEPRWDLLSTLTRRMCVLFTLSLCEKALQSRQPLGGPAPTTLKHQHNYSLGITRRVLQVYDVSSKLDQRERVIWTQRIVIIIINPRQLWSSTFSIGVRVKLPASLKAKSCRRDILDLQPEWVR